MKNTSVPNFEIVWPTPATPRALTVKGVYVVSHSCYEQLYELVCIMYMAQPLILRVFFTILNDMYSAGPQVFN